MASLGLGVGSRNQQKKDGYFPNIRGLKIVRFSTRVHHFHGILRFGVAHHFETPPHVSPGQPQQRECVGVCMYVCIYKHWHNYMSIQIQYIIITASLSHPTYWYKHTMQEFSSQAFVEAHLGMPRCLKGVARPKSINFRRFFSILSSRMDFKGSRWASTKREKRINNAAALHHPSSFIIHPWSFILHHHDHHHATPKM